MSAKYTPEEIKLCQEWMKTTWPEKDPEDLELIDTLLSQPLVRSLARFAGGSRPLERSSLPLTGSGGGRGAGDRSVSRESKEPAIEEKPTERSSDRTTGFTRREGGPILPIGGISIGSSNMLEIFVWVVTG